MANETNEMFPSDIDAAVTRTSDRGHNAEPTYSGALSFMRRRYTKDLSGVDVAVMGVPFDLSVSNRPGTRLGPRAVRAASAQLAWAAPWPWDFDPYTELSVVDYGDCLFDSGRPESVPGEIEAAAKTVLDAGSALLCLGGDHYITYPLIKAHFEKYGPLSLLQFDAHSDTWADEPGRIDHGTMLYHATNDGLIDPARSVQVGIRTHNPDTMGFNIIDGREVQTLGPVAVAEKIKSIIRDHNTYLTFDIDALDPSAAPGTGTPVIGGVQTYQAQEILRNLVGLNVVGMDVVEVSPSYDVSEITALAAATLANDILCLHAKRNGKAD